MTAAGAICLAVFQPDRDLLSKQLASIRQQTISDWSCLIGIDGRDDRTSDLVHQLVGGDARFHVRTYETNVGFYRNFERLLAAVSRDVSWVALADQDDYWYANKLEVLTGLLLSSPTCMIASGQARIVRGLGGVSEHTRRRFHSPVDLIFNNMITGSFVVFRPAVLDGALPFPPATDVAYHDHWIGVCASLYGTVQTVRVPLQDYVQHGNNVVGEASRKSLSRKWNDLRRGSTTPLQAIEYLVRHRWGWRVSMAELALDRMPTTASAPLQDRRDCELVARGRPSFRLGYLLVRSGLRRATPPVRVLSHFVGMLVFRRSLSR
ncbi:glycosyltransferase [Aeromicrobium yanjiei]|uniref:glycosyltransferase n=1 Tax=Aeromicrobium yanjiei TaxID=2662028 RepID=UPI00129DD8A1